MGSQDGLMMNQTRSYGESVDKQKDDVGILNRE
jgi:hypothetical protein